MNRVNAVQNFQTRLLTMQFLSSAVLLIVAAPTIFAQQVNVKSFGACGNGTCDDTKAIQAAIASGGSDIYFPKGRYKVTSTVMFGSATSVFRSVHVHGDGGGENQYTAASSIVWAGAPNGAVIQVTSAQNCRFEDIHIDGGGNAGVGLLLAANNAGGGSNHRNVFDGLTFGAINGAPGIAIHVNGNLYGQDQDVCCSEFRHIGIYSGWANGGPSAVKIGIRQEGRQSVHMLYEDVTMLGYTQTGMDFLSGDVRMRNASFTGANSALDDVRISNAVDWVSIYDSYHEIDSGASGRHAYNFPDGPRPFSTVLVGVRVRWALTAGTPLYFGQRGDLSLLGGSWDGAPSGTSILQIKNLGYRPVSLIGVSFLNGITVNATGTILGTYTQP